MQKRKSMNITNVKTMVTISLMAAVLCVLGPLSIPIGLVPLSLTNLAIYITLYALGMKKGTVCTLVYLLLGLLGLPVFSSYSCGPGKLFGPTGGYLIGFIFMALIAGYFIDRFIKQWYLCILGMILGTAVCYLFGTTWLAYEANLSLSSALSVGVLPFIPGDLAKIVMSAVIGPKISQTRGRFSV